MLAKNVTRQELDSALEAVNALYDGNIVYKDIRPQGKHIRFTLTVKDSKKAGSRRSSEGRRIAAACWHVHGHFFDALPPHAVIVANGEIIRPGDRWQDRNIGSQYRPFYYSEACEC